MRRQVRGPVVRRHGCGSGVLSSAVTQETFEAIARAPRRRLPRPRPRRRRTLRAQEAARCCTSRHEESQEQRMLVRGNRELAPDLKIGRKRAIARAGGAARRSALLRRDRGASCTTTPRSPLLELGLESAIAAASQSPSYEALQAAPAASTVARNLGDRTSGSPRRTTSALPRSCSSAARAPTAAQKKAARRGEAFSRARARGRSRADGRTLPA